MITITRVNATLAVKPVGSNTAMDARSVNTEARVMRKGVLITFGGPNPHRFVSMFSNRILLILLLEGNNT